VTPAASPAIRFDGVSKSYRLYGSARNLVYDRLGLFRLRFWRPRPQFDVHRALHDMTLTIGHGERVGIVGRNGAGKTTLLKLITPNFEPTDGTVAVSGDVQALMQTGAGSHPELSGRENARSGLLHNGLIGDAFERALEDVIEFVELGDFLDQPVRTYSQGMRARLQFATATALSPDILIIDEVLSAGDGYFAVKCAERMKRLTSSGCTLLLVSHAMQQVRQFCERVIWIDAGRVVMDGPTDEVVDAYDRSFEHEETEPEPAAVSSSQVPAELYQLPNRLTKPFVVDAVLESEPVNRARDEEIADHLPNGAPVHRWPGRRGPRIVDFRVLSHGRPTARTRTGEDLDLIMDVCAETAGTYRVSYRVTIYGADGTQLAWTDSPVDEVELSPSSPRRVRLALSPVLLGHGQYLLSLAAFDRSDETEFDPVECRSDLLSRCYCLRIPETNDWEPPVVHYPALWWLGADPEAKPSRISGIQ
jgi:lipopolysaccharide transport system ATP-binding protein